MSDRVVRRRVRQTMLLVAVGLLGAASLPVVASAQDDRPLSNGSGPRTGTWLISFRDGVGPSEMDRLVTGSGATKVASLADIGAAVIEVPFMRQVSVLGRLSANGRVVSIERDATAAITHTPNDPRWDKQWGPRTVRAPLAWDYTTGSSSVIIAVVDTGVDPNQPDLRGRVMRGWDFHNNDGNPYDDNGHGTAVAGVAAAAGDDRVGIAGMCWKCRILPVKVLNGNGSGSHSNIAAGIVWAAKKGADVINLSLAAATDTEVMRNAVAFARRKGAVVVAAAGNEGTTRKFYPAAYPDVISVAATNSNDVLYKWSNRGSWVTLAAPGCALTTKPKSRWSVWCGTSFATPLVTGTAALMRSLRPTMSRRQVERILQSTPTSVRSVSSGRIDAYRSVRSVVNSITMDDYVWTGTLGPGDLGDGKTFLMSGDVALNVTWTGESAMSVTIKDPGGKVVMRQEEADGSIDLRLNASLGLYRVVLRQPTASPLTYTVIVDQQQ